MKNFLISIIFIAIVSGLFFSLALGVREMNIYINNIDNYEKIAVFEKGMEFECYPDTFGDKAYLVSQERGWEVFEQRFKKDDLLISISRCNERE